MKHYKNLGLLTFVMAAILGLSSCAKDFQDDINALNEKYTSIDQRVGKLETQVATMNSQMTQLSVLATAVENGFYVTEVKTTTDGYELTLNNGSVIILQQGPNNTLAPAPYISMTVINGIHYWTLNGMLITDGDGRPMRASGQAPVVRYNTVIQQWTISIDGGLTFQNLNVYASIVINDDILLQVINNYVSQHTNTLISQDVLYQIISTYIQQNYKKLFNVEVLNQVIVNYLDQHYTQIFDYDLLVKLFNQYNYEYAAKNIDVDVITNILITFIKENKEIFINNEILYEIIRNYIEINKIDIFSNELIVEVINNYIENNTNFINVELLTQIVNNYIDQHQDIIFNNQTFITILQQYVQENYTVIFSQDILYQILNNYITLNKTTIFNETLIKEIINNYVQNNYTTLISNEILYEIINNYITVNKTTVINEEILYQVISNYFKTNYKIFIDETFIKEVINNYITQNQTTIIDIDIVREVVNNYVRNNIYTIFDVNILNQLINNYFEENYTIINQYFSEYVGIIKDVKVSDDFCYVTLSDNKTLELTVYDSYARVRDRVQSIVVVPNSKGHITHYDSYDYVTLNYLVTPASMATVIANNANSRIGVDVMVSDGNGSYSLYHGENVTADSNGKLSVTVSWLKNYKAKSKAIALHVYDNQEGGTDYVTTFTPIDWTLN